MIEIVVIGMIWTVQGMVAAILPLKVKWGGSRDQKEQHNYTLQESNTRCVCVKKFA